MLGKINASQLANWQFSINIGHAHCCMHCDARGVATSAQSKFRFAPSRAVIAHETLSSGKPVGRV